uniref:Uncharacterized protein n=1 Tax=Caenorhabditis japonica TaxID=281687 RepID=A0A8R1E8N7_CAEJA
MYNEKILRVVRAVLCRKKTTNLSCLTACNACVYRLLASKRTRESHECCDRDAATSSMERRESEDVVDDVSVDEEAQMSSSRWCSRIAGERESGSEMSGIPYSVVFLIPSSVF